MTRELWGIFTGGMLAGAALFCLTWVAYLVIEARPRKRGPYDAQVPGPTYAIPPPPQPEPRVFYLCDHRACERCGGHPECSHTSRIEHAKNFERRFGSWREMETSAVRPPRPVEPKG